jgi:Carboxypeptidase regulatory-like domain
MRVVGRVLRVPLALICLSPIAALYGQDSATLNVIVVDPTSAAVAGARVVVVDSHRGVIHQADTNDAGQADFDNMLPSDYTVEVQRQGFNNYRIENMTLAVRARQELRVQLQVSAATGTRVDVVERIDTLTSDPTIGTTINHDFLEDLPVNGRNVENLITLAPGMTSAEGSSTGTGGFNANGLRSNMNYFTLDGVSLNQPGAAGGGVGGGGGGGGGRGGGGGGGGGGAGGVGGATSLMNIDQVQEVRVQTMSIAPEFGRTPGAQVVLTSRGGTNDYHGTLYDYLRSDQFDANNWFANSEGFKNFDLHEDRPGGVFGGPIIKNRTLFFVTYEQLNLTSPSTLLAIVPDAATRAQAPAALAPYLNAFPIANGPELIQNSAAFYGQVSNPLKTSTVSGRIDQIINPHMTAFVRYNVTPTTSERQTADALLTSQASHADTATVGLTSALPDGILNDLRVNYSTLSFHSKTVPDTLGGSVPLNDSEVFPAGITSANGVFDLNLLGFGNYTYGGQTRTNQAQANIVDSASKNFLGHQIKAGIDVRQIRETNHPNQYQESVSFNGLATTVLTPQYSFLTGNALNAQITTSVPEVYPTYLNFSAYGQDTWRITKWTTITYGVRWDVNPAPYARTGQQPFALAQDPVAGVTQNTPLYPTQWFDLAPRFGVAYNMSDKPGHEMVLRAGIGIFYDVGYGTTAGAFNGAPFTDVRTITQPLFPLNATLLAPPPMPPFRPYGQINAADLGLVAPRVYEWNGTWEKNFGVGTTFSVALVGSAGRNLAREETQATFSSAYDVAILTTNGAESDYNGVQTQFRKRLSSRFQMQLSYTWSHSIDTASSDFGGGGGQFASLFGNGQRGDSDYDIRHYATAAGTYEVPSPKEGLLRPLLNNWFIDFNALARTGLPFDVQGISTCTSQASTATTTTTSYNGVTTTTCAYTGASNTGLFSFVRPSLNGDPIWVSNSNVPGGTQLNPLAFVIPTGYTEGNLGRNTLRGFGAVQLDMSVRRVIPIGERVRLNLGVQAFNIFNHPNFANPTPQLGANLASPDFGIVTQMLNSGQAGVNSLYQPGGPRSMELLVRLTF